MIEAAEVTSEPVQGVAVELEVHPEHGPRLTSRRLPAPAAGWVTLQTEWAGLPVQDIPAREPYVPGDEHVGRVCSGNLGDPAALWLVDAGVAPGGALVSHRMVPATSLVPIGTLDPSLAVLVPALARALSVAERHPVGRFALIEGYGLAERLVHIALIVARPEVGVLVADDDPERALAAKAYGAEIATVPPTGGGIASLPGCAPHDLRRAVELATEHPQLLRPLIAGAVLLEEVPALMHRDGQPARDGKVVVRP